MTTIHAIGNATLRGISGIHCLGDKTTTTTTTCFTGGRTSGSYGTFVCLFVCLFSFGFVLFVCLFFLFLVAKMTLKTQKFQKNRTVFFFKQNFWKYFDLYSKIFSQILRFWSIDKSKNKQTNKSSKTKNGLVAPVIQCIFRRLIFLTLFQISVSNHCEVMPLSCA